MTLRIAFCGPNIKLNQRLSRETNDMISSFTEPRLLNHPLEELLEFTRSKDWALDLDWLTLYINVWRALTQIKLQEEDCIISPTCGIDNVATSAAWLSEQAKIIKRKTTLLDAQGNEMVTQDHAVLNRTGSILQVILNQAEQESIEYWDFIYAVLPVSSTLSNTNDELLTQYQDFITTVPAFDRVQRLPDNESSALDFLQQEVEKWKNVHSSSS